MKADERRSRTPPTTEGVAVVFHHAQATCGIERGRLPSIQQGGDSDSWVPARATLSRHIEIDALASSRAGRS